MHARINKSRSKVQCCGGTTLFYRASHLVGPRKTMEEIRRRMGLVHVARASLVLEAPTHELEPRL
jgi:hypothetical protein